MADKLLPTTHRACTICKKVKLLSEFHQKRKRARGYLSKCKVCRKKQKERNSRHKNKVKRATPPWADREAIYAFYRACPPGHNVDHIIPLGGKDVCGLHVLSNLRYLPIAENSKKGNDFNALDLAS